MPRNLEGIAYRVSPPTATSMRVPGSSVRKTRGGIARSTQVAAVRTSEDNLDTRARLNWPLGLPITGIVRFVFTTSGYSGSLLHRSILVIFESLYFLESSSEFKGEWQNFPLFTFCKKGCEIV